MRGNGVCAWPSFKLHSGKTSGWTYLSSDFTIWRFWSDHGSKELILLVHIFPKSLVKSLHLWKELHVIEVFMHLLEEIDSGTAIQMSSPWALYPEQVTSSGGPVDNHIAPRGRVDVVQTKLFPWHDLWYPIHLDACLVLKPCQAFSLSSSEGSRKFHLWLTWPEWFSPASNQNCDFNRHSGLPPFSYSERLIIILMGFQYISPYCKGCEERENKFYYCVQGASRHGEPDFGTSKWVRWLLWSPPLPLCICSCDISPGYVNSALECSEENWMQWLWSHSCPSQMFSFALIIVSFMASFLTSLTLISLKWI